MARAEDRARWRHDPSAAPGAKTEGGRHDAALSFPFGIGTDAANRPCLFLRAVYLISRPRFLHFTLNQHTRMQRVWAYGGYSGELIKWVSSFCQWILEIVKRNDDVKGFKLLPKRWVVERTFSWLSSCRRLSKHYEYWNETGEAMVQVAMIRLRLRRLCKETMSGGLV